MWCASWGGRFRFGGSVVHCAWHTDYTDKADLHGFFTCVIPLTACFASILRRSKLHGVALRTHRVPQSSITVRLSVSPGILCATNPMPTESGHKLMACRYRGCCGFFREHPCHPCIPCSTNYEAHRSHQNLSSTTRPLTRSFSVSSTTMYSPAAVPVRSHWRV